MFLGRISYSETIPACVWIGRDSVLRWFRDAVDHKVGHGFVFGFELKPELLLHRSEDRGPTFWIVLGPLAAKLERVIVGASETGLV